MRRALDPCRGALGKELLALDIKPKLCQHPGCNRDTRAVFDGKHSRLLNFCVPHLYHFIKEIHESAGEPLPYPKQLYMSKTETFDYKPRFED